MAIALVQATSKQVSSVSSTTISLPSPATAGNCVVVFTASWTGQSSSVTDNQSGNTYNSLVAGVVGGNNPAVRIWAALNVNASGTFTATVNLSPLGDATIIIAEFSGVATSGAAEVANTATGTGTAVSVSTSATTTDTGDIVIGIVTHAGGTMSITESGTLIAEQENNSTSQCGGAQYTLSGSTGVKTLDWTLGSSDTWLAAIVALKPAGGGAATRAPVIIAPDAQLLPTAQADSLLIGVRRSATVAPTRAPRIILADAPAWNPAAVAGAQWPQIIGRQNRPARRRQPIRFIQADTPVIAPPALDDFIVPVPKATGIALVRRGVSPLVADAPQVASPALDDVILVVPRAPGVVPTIKAGSAPIIADSPIALQAAFDDYIIAVPRSAPVVPPTRAGFTPMVVDTPAIVLPMLDAQIISILRATYRAPALIQAWAPASALVAPDAMLIVVPRGLAQALRVPAVMVADAAGLQALAGTDVLLTWRPAGTSNDLQLRFYGGLRARDARLSAQDATLSARDARLSGRNIDGNV